MSINTLTQGGFSIGVELPLDNDWTPQGEANRLAAGRKPGEPDMSQHQELVKLADQLGFRAAWVRDVPLYDPAFGDAAQVFEIFSYLGYLAGVTQNILLGTAAVVLPLRQSWLVRKAAASVQALSHNRLLLGVASGDRPAEYPLFGEDFASRGKAFRESVAVLQGERDHQLAPGQAILPKTPQPPLLVAGFAQQSLQWVADNIQGLLAYPGTPSDHKRRVAQWRQLAGNKPYVSFIHLDLLADKNAPIKRHHFGMSGGSKALVAELAAMQEVGVDHIGLHFRRNQRPLSETFMAIASDVLPKFHGQQPLID
ncbi:TIGR03571 family LLM class oxidoreductase [Gallaecimonas pentaromativorans]|uniref:TIGR03571 family LLM class oxidoreductase n=1 Tax=Gallaecimonas pentaromativorans TaxID=584787 RepID=UPI003A8E18A4